MKKGKEEESEDRGKVREREKKYGSESSDSEWTTGWKMDRMRRT